MQVSPQLVLPSPKSTSEAMQMQTKKKKREKKNEAANELAFS
jgi:hypothetical protein